MTEYIERQDTSERFIPKSYIQRTRLSLIGKNWAKTKKIGTLLGITTRDATLVIRALGWILWARGTYYRPGTFDKE